MNEEDTPEFRDAYYKYEDELSGGEE